MHSTILDIMINSLYWDQALKHPATDDSMDQLPLCSFRSKVQPFEMLHWHKHPNNHLWLILDILLWSNLRKWNRVSNTGLMGFGDVTKCREMTDFSFLIDPATLFSILIQSCNTWNGGGSEILNFLCTYNSVLFNRITKLGNCKSFLFRGSPYVPFQIKIISLFYLTVDKSKLKTSAIYF